MTRIILVFYIQIKYVLFIYPVKMIRVPAVCQAVFTVLGVQVSEPKTPDSMVFTNQLKQTGNKQLQQVVEMKHFLVFISCTEVQEYSSISQHPMRKTETPLVMLTEGIYYKELVKQVLED